MRLYALLPLVLVLSCARFSTKQTDLSYGTNGVPVREVTTKASAITFFSAKSELAKFKASQTDKTQSATVGSLNQQAEGTNAVAAIQALANLLSAIKGW